MQTFTAQTDKKKKITVESAIIYALWDCPAAVANSEAPIIVRTSLVGHGATIEIKGKSSKGKSPGTIKGPIYGNYFQGKLPIPDKIDPDAEIWFEAKLPKHGLSAESNKIPASPSICVKKMEWDRQIARRGDIVKMTCEFESGVLEKTAAKVSIFEYDSDGNHDSITSFESTVQNGKIEVLWEYEYHEDTDEIMTEDEKQKYGGSYNPPEYFFTVLINGENIGTGQESGLLEFKDFIELSLIDSLGQPVLNEKYEIRLPDGSVVSGQLDGDGKATIVDIPPGPYDVAFQKTQITG